MPRPKRRPKDEKNARAQCEQPPDGETRKEPERPRVQFSADGMIEEAPASSWERASHAETNDSRSLAELAASVMASPPLTAAQVAAEGVAAEPESSAGRVQPHAPRRRVEVTIGGLEPEPEPESRKPAAGRRGTRAIVLLLVILAAMGVAWLRSTVDTSAPDSPAEGQLVAAPPDGGPPVEGSAPPAAVPPSQEGAVIPPAAPTPEPAPAQQAAPAPAPPPAPAPTAAPAPAPVPPPPPAPPPTVHIGDLDGAPKGGKVFVQIWMHDASHNPVAGATVSVAWQGASGPASCVTGAGGSCTVHTNNVSSPATVTLTVTGVSIPGGTYEAGSNHDPDGDSSGTAITVGF